MGRVSAATESSDLIRSGRSSITFRSLSCLELDCQRGTRCSRCLHSCDLPSAMHFAHDSWTDMHENIGAPVMSSRIWISRE